MREKYGCLIFVATILGIIASLLDINGHIDILPFLGNSNNGKMYYVVNCKQSITLRTAPDVYADEITQIPLGAPVVFLNNAKNGFFKINYDGVIGFALASYLAPGGN